MSDALHSNVRAAIRAALATVAKASVGPSTDLSLARVDDTTAVVTRGAGSFLTDRVSPGDEIIMAGWGGAGNNGAWYVTQASATQFKALLPADAVRTIVTEAAGASITIVGGAPTGQKDGNTAFEPTPGQTWWRETYQGGPEKRRSLATVFQAGHAAQAQVRLNFLYQLSVFYPLGVGTSGPDGMVDAIRATLYAGRVLTYNSQAVTILETSRKGELELPGWLLVPVSVRGFAYTITP